MSLPIIGPLISLAETWIDGHQKKSRAKAEFKADWENIQAEASRDSWKDEFWTLIFGGLFISAFFPDTREHVNAAFVVLEEMPQWVQYCIGLSIGASFGVKLSNKFSMRK